MLEYVTDHASVIAASFSALAALLAAVATWRGPLSAAKLAERLRREGDDAYEAKRVKLQVFSTIMQERAAIWSQDGVRALNLIDVAFNQSSQVREAWAELFQAFDANQRIPEHAKDERLRKLLRAMAIDLRLSEGLRLDDFARVYFPTAMAQEQLRQTLEREESIRHLQGGASPSSNTAISSVSQNQWPPRPQ